MEISLENTHPNEMTWLHVEREALHCPVLNRMIHVEAMESPLIRERPATREQIMIWTLLWFSRHQREMIAREVERLKNSPFEMTTTEP